MTRHMRVDDKGRVYCRIGWGAFERSGMMLNRYSDEAQDLFIEKLRGSILCDGVLKGYLLVFDVSLYIRFWLGKQ